MSKVTMRYTDEAEKAYTAVEALANKHGNVGYRMSQDSVNVPGVLRGEFLITGGREPLKAGNLAGAIAKLAVTNTASSIYHVTDTGRKLVVRK